MEILENLLKEEKRLLIEIQIVRSKKAYYQKAIDVFKDLDIQLEKVIKEYNIKEGQTFNNPITGFGTIARAGIKNRRIGIYFFPESSTKEWFAEFDKIKFKTIVETRLNQ